MTEPLLLASRSSASGRTAIVSDEGDSVWLYLSRADSQQPERDCWLFNKSSAPPAPDARSYMSRGSPPPAPAEMVAPNGVQEPPAPARWSFRWSARGDAVAVAIDGLEIGAVALEAPKGFALYLAKLGPWGRPWDASVIANLF